MLEVSQSGHTGQFLSLLLFVVVVVSITLVGFLLEFLELNLLAEGDEVAVVFFEEVLLVVAALFVFLFRLAARLAVAGLFFAALTEEDKIEDIVKIENSMIV